MTDAARYSVAEYLERWREVKRLSAELEGPSLADRLALCERHEPGFVEGLLDDLGPQGCLALAYSWAFWGRPKQLAPIKLGRAQVWRVLLLIAGRGFGKTRPASEWVVDRLLAGARVLLLVGPSEGDVKEFMVGGLKRRVNGGNGSGLLDVLPPWVRYHYREDDGVIEFPDFHAAAYLHSAEVPEYRGPEPDTVWGDELLKWRYPKRLLDNIRLACRAVGKVEPQIMLTTSPKKLQFLRDLVMEDDVVTIHGRTQENRGNVHDGWFQGERKRLAGTPQGAEELDGELGVDDGSEIFPLGVIDAHRVDEAPPLDRIAVGIDPAVSKHRKSDATGIVAMGRRGDASSGHGYVLGDKTGRYTPEEWGDEAFDLLEAVGGSCFVVERNRAGDMAAANLRAAGARRTTNYERGRRKLPPVDGGDADGWRPAERKAARGVPAGTDLVRLDAGGRIARRVQIIEILAMGDKATRAEPVSTLYHSGRVHHVGTLSRLEIEQSEWDPGMGVSPNGLDALVHAAIHLFGLSDVPQVDARAGLRGYPEAVARMQAQTRSPDGRPGGLQDLLGSLMRGHRGSSL